MQRLCIFGPKGAIQIRYYYYYFAPLAELTWLMRVLLRLAISLAICVDSAPASSTRPDRMSLFFRRNFALIVGVI